MNTVFADTFYWIAITKVNDSYYTLTKQIRNNLGGVSIITSEEVLSEFLTFFSNHGFKFREMVCKIVRKIINDPNIKIIEQSHNSFMIGLDLYEQRKDKGYSLVDCISINIMKLYSIKDVLTNDHHFEQEGFNVLIKKH